MRKEIDIEPNYTVIVPVFNSAETLEELVSRIDKTMTAYAPYELLLIDDFSTDNSWEELIRIKAGRRHIRLLQLTKNFGQAAATICGVREAKANVLIVTDDDLQFPPEEMSKLIDAFDPENKYVLFGVPKKKKTSLFQKFTTAIIEGFINQIVFKGTKEMRFSSFRIITKIRYKREEYNESRMKSAQIFFTMVSPELMDYIYVDHQPRKKGHSQYSFLKRLRIALELILVNTEMPWYLFIFTAFIFFFLAVGLCMLFLIMPSLEISRNLLVIFLSGGFSVIAFGFVLMFGYVKKIMLGFLGAEVYAIWKEA